MQKKSRQLGQQPSQLKLDFENPTTHVTKGVTEHFYVPERIQYNFPNSYLNDSVKRKKKENEN